GCCRGTSNESGSPSADRHEDSSCPGWKTPSLCNAAVESHEVQLSAIRPLTTELFVSPVNVCRAFTASAVPPRESGIVLRAVQCSWTMPSIEDRLSTLMWR